MDKFSDISFFVLLQIEGGRTFNPITSRILDNFAQLNRIFSNFYYSSVVLTNIISNSHLIK
ncbi:MAG: hypothetical protein BGO35_02435 [Burkholderiales bacterium 64-34]|nr:MAG: hypothetical protein BGO35_02435 [Burkholderiales bacterium 64-34]